MTEPTPLVVLAPDSATATHICARIQSRDEPTPTVILRSRKRAITQLKQQLSKLPAPVLLSTSGLTPDPEILDIAADCISRRGQILIWDIHSDTDHSAIQNQLLRGLGAIISPRLHPLLDAAAIHCIRGPSTIASIRVATGQNAVLERLRTTLPRSAQNPSHPALSLSLSRTGALRIRGPLGKTDLHADPIDIAKICHSLCSHANAPSLPVSPAPVDQAIVDMIARPPARLLSETTSKRLLAAFDMELPDETLCTSPSAAVRFARHHRAPFILSLVRPEMSDKYRIGAIRNNLQTQGEIRSAYQSLMDLAEQIGPPAPLGILVTEHIPFSLCFSLKQFQHPDFGVLITLKHVTDSDSNAEPLVIGTPGTDAMGLYRALTDHEPDTQNRLTLTRCAHCFANAIGQLGRRVTRVEANFGITETAVPVLTDALVGISDEE